MRGVSGVIFRLCPVLLPVQHFIESFKYQLFARICKAFRDLPPEAVKARTESRVAFLCGLQPPMGARVVMHVQQAYHAFIQDPADDLCYPVHPARVHPAAGIQMLRPGDGQTDGAEPGVAYSADHGAGDGRIVPGGFSFQGRHKFVGLRAALDGVQGIAQVPSGTDRREQGLCGGHCISSSGQSVS